jgi:hypothetical protein
MGNHDKTASTETAGCRMDAARDAKKAIGVDMSK